MKQNLESITIGFIARERFAVAKDSLKSIIDNTDIDYNLVVVDAGMPEACREDLVEATRRRSNVTFLKVGRFLLPNEAKNLVIDASRDDYICFVENDVIVKKGWLSSLIQTSKELDADVVIPMILERNSNLICYHGFGNTGYLDIQSASGQQEMTVRPLGLAPYTKRIPCVLDAAETHCMLFRRTVFDRIGNLDGSLNTREWLDLCLELQRHHQRLAFDPATEVIFEPPHSINEDEREFYFFHWDEDKARMSHDRIREKWKLKEMLESHEFIKDRIHRGKREHAPEFEFYRDVKKTQDAVGMHVPKGSSVIIAGYGSWYFAAAPIGYYPFPFIEKYGRYLGLPKDDDAAILEFERLVTNGATAFVLAGEALWWKNHYKRFFTFLGSRFQRTCPEGDPHIYLSR